VFYKLKVLKWEYLGNFPADPLKLSNELRCGHSYVTFRREYFNGK